MSRRVERLIIWLGAAGGGFGLIYAALANSADIVPAVLGVMWVLGAAALVVGVLGFATETVSFINRVLPDETPSSTPPPAAPAPTAPIRQAPIAAPNEPEREPERQFVQLSPKYVGGLFKTHTSREAKNLLADFIGKWIEVSGTVRDVSELSNFVYVSLEEHPNDLGVSAFTLSFRGEWRDRVSTLRRGDPIRAIGRINEIDRIRIDLDPCELRPGQSNSPAIS